MQYTINELRQKVFEPVLNTYEVFRDYFGEEFTDLQGLPPDEYLLPVNATMETLTDFDISNSELEGIRASLGNRRPFIVVWWPSVTVTNEHNRSVDIQDLYAKIQLTYEGCIPYENVGFQLVRSTFTDVQFASRYIHSHVPGRSNLPSWQNPCLGRGPINRTIGDLKNQWDDIKWMLFCEELSRYVTVESLTGGPYRKLEEIGSARSLRQYDSIKSVSMESLRTSFHMLQPDYLTNLLRDFTDYYLSNGHLTASFMNGNYVVGMTAYEFFIDISNSFISWVNQNCDRDRVTAMYTSNILINAFVAGGKFYENRHVSRTDREYEGQEVLVFKDNSIPLRIIDAPSSEFQTTTLLNHEIALCILTSVFKIINYRFNNDHNNSNNSAASAASTHQTVRYI